jgi:hypothetical protein
LLALRWNTEEEQWNLIGPPSPRDFVRVIVGYALTCKLRLPAIAHTIEEARYQARKQNRSRLLATDIQAALLNYQIPSDAALQQAFETQGKARSSGAASGRAPNMACRLGDRAERAGRCPRKVCVHTPHLR